MSNPNLPAEGIYRGPIKEWSLSRAGKNRDGNYQWVLSVRVTERAKNPDDISEGFEPVEKPFIRMVFNTITPKTIDRVIEDAKFLGFQSTDILNLDTKGPEPHDFSGTVAQLSCSHEEYPEGSGKVRDKWQINRRKERKPLNENELDDLAALFGDRFKDRMTPDPETAEEYFDKKTKENRTQKGKRPPVGAGK